MPRPNVTTVTVETGSLRIASPQQMSTPHKATALTLALLIAAVGIVGASTCPRELAPMNGSDQAMAMMGMPMPGMSSSQRVFSETRTDLCCHVAPAELPKQTSLVSAGKTAAEVPAATLHGIEARSATMFVLNACARSLGPPPQAQLCVFLI